MKRLFAVLLAFIIMLSVMPLSAFAASYDKGFENGGQTPSAAAAKQSDAPHLSDELFKPKTVTQTTQTPVDASSVSMKATDSFGRLLLAAQDELSEENSTTYPEGNRVIRILMDGSTATVSYSAEEDAELVVALYTDDGQEMLASGRTSVSATSDGTATVTINGPAQEHYRARGYLLDRADHGAMSPVFETTLYTEEMIDLKEAKASDFEPEQVINLDNNDDTNFAVVKPSTTLVKRDAVAAQAAGGASQLIAEDDDALIYTISNPEDEILALKKDDILVYEYSEGELLVARVKKMEVNGTTVTIYGDENLEMSDAFEMIKIEQSAGGSEFTFEEGSEGEGVEYLGMVETPQTEEDETNGIFEGLFDPKQDHVTDSFSMSFKINGSVKSEDGDTTTTAAVTGGLTATAALDVAYYLAANRQYVALTGSTSLSGSITISGALKHEWPLAYFGVSPIPGVYIEIAPAFTVDVSGSMTASFTVVNTRGGSWETGIGYTDLSRDGNSKVTVTADVEIYVGINLKPHIAIVGKLLDFTLDAKGGIAAKFTDTVYTTSDSEIHSCLTCFSFTVKLRAEVGISFKLFNSEHWKFTHTFGKLEVQPPYPRSYGYWSLTYGEFAFGRSCPHKAYKVKIKTLQNGYGGSPVYVTGNSEPVAELDDAGEASFHLDPGTYRISANVNGRVYSSNEFEVSDHPLEITLFYVASGMLSGKVCAASDRVTPIENALVEVSENGQPVMNVWTDAQGQYALTLRDGSYTIKISAGGYQSFTSRATVNPGSNTYLESFLMVQGEEGDIGTASGYLRNSLNGRGVVGATLTIRKNWNNVDGDIVLTTTTALDGSYEVSLPIGNYTVSAEMAGYNKTSFNIVVQTDNNFQQNGLIEPIAESLDQVTIALRWGSDPRDLDSHIVGKRTDGSQFHVYFGIRDAYDGNVHVVNLDVDDTDGYGPEHITLNSTTSEPYYYYVYHYSGYGSLATSEAQVTIYKGNEEIARFSVPTDQGNDRYWNVFAIVDGKLVIRNTITYTPDLSYASAEDAEIASFAMVASDELAESRKTAETAALERRIAEETESPKTEMNKAA